MRPIPNRPDPLASSDPLEARVDPRTGADFAVRVYTTEIRGALEARSRDLSVGGACIATATPFAYKSVQRVRLELPEGPLELRAEGRWQSALPHDDMVMTGLAFLDPPDEAVDRLWDTVLEAGKHFARFIHTRSEIRSVGLEGAMALAQVSRFRQVPAGQALYRQGPAQPGERSIFLLDEGAVSLQVRVRGAREASLERLGGGALFGGLALVAGVDHPESALADTASRVLEIDERAFLYLARSRPWLAQRLSQAVTCSYARRLHAVLERVRDLL